MRRRRIRVGTRSRTAARKTRLRDSPRTRAASGRRRASSTSSRSSRGERTSRPWAIAVAVHLGQQVVEQVRAQVEVQQPVERGRARRRRPSATVVVHRPVAGAPRPARVAGGSPRSRPTPGRRRAIRARPRPANRRGGPANPGCPPAAQALESPGQRRQRPMAALGGQGRGEARVAARTARRRRRPHSATVTLRAASAPTSRKVGIALESPKGWSWCHTSRSTSSTASGRTTNSAWSVAKRSATRRAYGRSSKPPGSSKPIVNVRTGCEEARAISADHRAGVDPAAEERAERHVGDQPPLHRRSQQAQRTSRGGCSERQVHARAAVRGRRQRAAPSSAPRERRRRARAPARARAAGCGRPRRRCAASGT